MEEQMDVNVEMKKATDGVIKSNKCNKCDYASSHEGHFGIHFIMHSGEKSNKCNQCKFAFFQAGDLRRHMKTHSGENQTNAINVTLHHR